MNHTVTDRASLGFPQAATRAFRFLETLYGMRLERDEPTSARWTGNGIFVNVWHGRQSYEIGLELGRAGHSSDTTDPFRSGDLIARAEGTEAAAAHRNFTASTPESVERGVSRLAAILESYGASALRGEVQSFAEMSDLRRERVLMFADEVTGEQLRAKASAAWRRRDLAAVAKLLAQMEPSLTPAEQARLAYARRHT